MDFDTMIEDKREEKKILVEKMEAKKGEILSELAVFSKKWFKTTTMYTVKESPDKLLAMGEDKARKLKEEIAALEDNVSEQVAKHADKKEFWWHEYETNRSYHFSNVQALPELNDPTRLILGEFGKILIKYELISHSSNDWKQESREGEVKYGYSISFSDKLCTLSKEFVELIKVGREINSEISKTEDKKKRENIEEWWNTL
ncbi:hypothetical protein [Sporosarcina beigongshangi]|uniref:hypothetical protein n=1 Tax=Sporosarcina beigongshangi TaxID=2782538 RepID=UPI0019392A48|nr:hypothetical protein [Sporosarcina beigongshangi]